MNIDKLIQNYENRINNLIDTNYNTFYIQPIKNKGFTISPDKHGVVFNGDVIAVARDLQELESIINAISFTLQGAIKKW